MPNLAQAATAPVTATADATLSIQNPGGFARVTDTASGTTIWEGGAGLAQISMRNAAYTINAVRGSLYYEVTVNQSPKYAPNPAQTASEFSAALRFNAHQVMPLQSVAGVIAFTVDSTVPLAEGATIRVELNPDGYNVPTFTGMTEDDGSSGYVNTNGVRNRIVFWTQNGVVYYSIKQKLGAAAEAALLTSQIVRLGTLTLLTESGDAVSGWSYRHQGNVSNYAAAGRSDKGLQANTDGEITTRLDQLASGGNMGFFLYPANGVPNPADYRGSTQYGVLVDSASQTRDFTNGTVGATVTTWTLADLDVLRLKRVGATLTAEFFTTVSSVRAWYPIKSWTLAGADITRAWSIWMLFNGASGPMQQAYNLRGQALA